MYSTVTFKDCTKHLISLGFLLNIKKPLDINLFKRGNGSHTQNVYQTTPKELQSHVQKL